jgi:hypothetical protein
MKYQKKINRKFLNGLKIDLKIGYCKGKLGDIICGEADAIGYVYRKKNETIISFEGGEGTVREARANHLRGKKIVVAESDDDNNITFHMDRIFLEQ